ncbi:MAG: radical SAM family heme chaperone HemW [Clostridia bacterium]|nr:radical SAM family heme chaperone HemW [Clostridia bacterium]
MTGIYVHIPYCVRKCAYCDFCSVPRDETTEQYPDALCREIELSRDRLPYEGPVPSVFFGGGTPTALPAEALIRILETVRRTYEVRSDAEITVECNPGTATYADFVKLRAAGFNRLSLGLQSANDELLKAVGRIHTYDQFLTAFRAARDAGFQNINVDLMHGLPGQTQGDYLDTLQKVCDLGPEHISAYALILEEGTPLYTQVRAGEIALPDEDAVADMEDAGMAFLKQRGYERYEVSNFAKSGYECRHNLIYWDDAPYLGFGVAAHSSARGEGEWLRWSNTESIPEYLRKLRRGKLPTAETLQIDRKEELFEVIMLGLRKVKGIPRQAFLNRFGLTLEQAFPDAWLNVQANGWWADSPTHYALTKHGMDYLNTVLCYFR